MNDARALVGVIHKNRGCCATTPADVNVVAVYLERATNCGVTAWGDLKTLSAPTPWGTIFPNGPCTVAATCLYPGAPRLSITLMETDSWAILCAGAVSAQLHNGAVPAPAANKLTGNLSSRIGSPTPIVVAPRAPATGLV